LYPSHWLLSRLVKDKPIIKVTMKSNMNILNFFNGILQLIIYQDLHIFILFIFDSHVLISISSLMTCLLAQERDNNLSLA